MTPWNEIESLIPVFKNTFNQVVDFDRFNLISITFHSTVLEGSTLTLQETELLLDKGLSPQGKPFAHQQMVVDHHQALTETLRLAKEKTTLSVDLIRKIASLVMARTGSVITTPLGTYDSSKGDLRLNNARAGTHYFVNYDKVKPLLEELVTYLNDLLPTMKTPAEMLTLSFKAHCDLVTIHPFADGNGRTARLLGNFVQHYHNLPIAPVFIEDRKAYIEALTQARNQNNLKPFVEFMAGQYAKYLSAEIASYQVQLKQLQSRPDKPSGKGYSLIF